MHRLVRGSERPGGKGRKCWAQVTTEPHQLGRCPRCGCDHMWTDVTYGRARERVAACRDPKCPYIGRDGTVYPHSRYSVECLHNPHRDFAGMADGPGGRATMEDPPW